MLKLVIDIILIILKKQNINIIISVVNFLLKNMNRTPEQGFWSAVAYDLSYEWKYKQMLQDI